MKDSRVRAMVVVSVLGVLAVVALAWFLVLSPRLSQADEIAAQAEQAETGNLQLRNRVNQARDQVALAPAAAAEAQQLFATMPRAAELPTVLRQITDAAEKAGIRPANVSVISTSLPVAAGPPAAEGASGVSIANMDVGVTVAGSRESLLGFLGNLQALDRAFLITSTQVTQGDPTTGGGAESLQVQGRMFVLRSELPDLVAQVEKLIAEAEGASPDSASGSTTAPSEDAASAG